MRKLLAFILFFPLLLSASEVVYTIPPSDFAAKMTVSGCFCKKEGKFLILLRNPNRSCGSTWCLPAKKISMKESPITVAVRELEEAVGVRCAQENFSLFKKFYVRLPDKDFELYLFEVTWPSDQKIRLNQEEHAEFAWVSLEEALAMPLIPGAEVYFRLLFEKRALR